MADCAHYLSKCLNAGGVNTSSLAVSELVQEKLVSALRTVAATKDLVELHSKRDEFAASVQQLGKWYQEGRLRPHVSETFPLESAAKALNLMAARQVKGKVVLTVG